MRIQILSMSTILNASQKLKKDGRPVEYDSCLPVKVIPFVAEQGSVNSPYVQGPLSVKNVIDRIHKSLKMTHLDLSVLDKCMLPDENYWGACLKSFSRHVVPHLPKFSFIFSHGNYMRLQLANAVSNKVFVPNGGVIYCRLESKNIFFVRHCVTCHNIDKQGSAALTICENFDSLSSIKQFISSLRQQFDDAHIGIFSSPLPRAILSGIHMTNDIPENQRMLLCKAFDACRNKIPRHIVEKYEETWKCMNSSKHGPFCTIARPLELHD